MTSRHTELFLNLKSNKINIFFIKNIFKKLNDYFYFLKQLGETKGSNFFLKKKKSGGES